MNTSPYQQNTHIGIMAEGKLNGSGCKNCTYRGNVIDTVLGGGMESSPDNPTRSPANQNENIVFENNIAQNVGRGLSVNHTRGLIARNNIIQSLTDRTGWAVLVYPDAASIDIQGNQITGPQATMVGALIQLLGGTGVFIKNTIYTYGGQVMYVAQPSNWITSPNTIIQ